VAAKTTEPLTIVVTTPVGPAECVLRRPVGPARAILAIGHGAGGDLGAPDIVALSAAAVAAGMAVAGVRQPYRVAGRRAAAPAAQLDAAWGSVMVALRQTHSIPGASSLPLATAGRSSGARVACRTAASTGAVAVIALAFPLRPPGRLDRSRAYELEIAVPLRVLQGSRDAFGRPSEFPATIDVAPVDGSDHGLKSAALGEAVGEAVEWLVAILDRLAPRESA
jgi:predicted alpha/beta-hydrolase family hydrolase